MEASDQKILDYVRILSISLQRRNAITNSDIEPLKNLYDAGQAYDCIAKVKQLCGLKLTVIVARIKGYPDKANMVRIFDNFSKQFKYPLYKPSSDEFNDLQRSLDSKKVPAFILKPSNLPMFGTQEFENFRVAFFILEWIIELSFESFTTCVAHEMSHIVLDAMRHPLREDEIAVDITAMILGFHDIFHVGRKSEKGKIGYLNDHQFKIAYDEIIRRKKLIYL